MAHTLLPKRPNAETRPLLTDLEKGEGEGAAQAAAREASAGSEGLSRPRATPSPWVTGGAIVRWHWRAQHLNDTTWLFTRLLSGEVPGLVPALVRGESDLLSHDDESLRKCREHLRETVEGCKELFEGRERMQGVLQREICIARAGRVGEMGPDELYCAYSFLVQEILSKPCLTMRAPVNYRLCSSLSRAFTWGKDVSVAAPQEGHYPRKEFDLTEVRLIGAQLLHIAVERDSLRLERGEPAEYVERLLDAQADINVPAFYETNASDSRQPGAMLKTAVRAIHLAVDHGSSALVDLLLRRRASPDSRAVFDMTPDYTPLHLAAARGLGAVAHRLIEAGGNAAETDLSGRGSHQVAAASGYPGLVPQPDACALVREDSELDAQRQPPRQSLSRHLTSSAEALEAPAPPPSLSAEAQHDGHVLFTACAQNLLHRELQRPRRDCQLIASGSEDPNEQQLEQRIRQALGGRQINDLFNKPLPEGRFYKKTKALTKGCLLHFAVDLALRFEAEGKAQPEAIVRLVLKANANVHARAHYNNFGIPHTCTALHMAAAAGSASVLDLLIDAKASVEAMVTSDAKAHYTPLLDATFEGHYDVCRLLLERRADPNVPNRLGRTCLHLAVLDGNGGLARLLTEHGCDVTLEERLFQERPLLCTTRARDEYRLADMLYLCRSYQDNRCSILHDLSSLAVRRGRLAVDLLDFIVNPSAEGGDLGLKRVKEAMLRRVGRAAAEGRPDEHGLTPVDHLATILENAPRAGIRLLADVFMATPDVQDPTHGPLPVYANLREHRNSWQPWLRWFAPVEPVLCDYKPDTRRRRSDGREWPCWLFDSTQSQAEPEWHRHFAPLESAVYESRDHQIVKMKVLLVANILSPRFMNALASAWWDTDIFAEMPARAIVGFVYSQLVRDVILLMKFMEFSLICTLVTWAWADDGVHSMLAHRLCWVWCAAVSFQELIVFSWTLIHYISHGWRLGMFFSSFENCFGPFAAAALWALMFCTASGAHGLDSSHIPFEDSHYHLLNRTLLGTNIILRSSKLVMLFRFSDVCGTGILAVVHSLHGVCTMFIVLAACFASFAAAFLVMNKGHIQGEDLVVKVYRGLMLSDDGSLDAMEHVWGGQLGSGLMVMGTAVFTVYLLNILIAVLTAEYHKADAKATLLLWRERAYKSSQVLLGPVWPWCSGEQYDRPASLTRCSPWHCLASSLWCCLGGKMDGDDSVRWRRLADLAMIVLSALSVTAMCFPVHALLSAVPCGLMLTVVRARLLRSEAWGAQKRGKRYYLWVCHRADYSRLTFIREDVQKEHVDELREKVETLEGMLKDIHKKLMV